MRRVLGALLAAATVVAGTAPTQKGGAQVVAETPRAIEERGARLPTLLGGLRAQRRPGFIWNAWAKRGRSGGKRSRWNYNR